jgi:hypothetical protein
MQKHPDAKLLKLDWIKEELSAMRAGRAAPHSPGSRALPVFTGNEALGCCTGLPEKA